MRLNLTMGKIALALTLALPLTLSATAQAGNPNLCARDGWVTAQSSSGQAFASMKDCAKAREVFQPTASISPTHVVADEPFWLTVTGFHPNASTTIYFAITGEAPYASYTPFYPTLADGSFSIPFVYAACRQIDTGGDVTVDLTFTLVDSFGVHASAPLTLC